MSTKNAGSELPRGTLLAVGLTPVVATLATWCWSYVLNQTYPDWYARECVQHIPAPWVVRLGDIIPGCMVLVGLVATITLLRRGHGWLTVIVFLYYAAALWFLAASNFVMFYGFC